MNFFVEAKYKSNKSNSLQTLPKSSLTNHFYVTDHSGHSVVTAHFK